MSRLVKYIRNLPGVLISIPVIYMAVFYSTETVAQDYWQMLNTPQGLTLKDVVVDQWGSIYLACYENNLDGGVYRSDDDAQTWQRKINGITNPYVSFLSLAFDNNGTLFGGGQSMLYKSDDRAESWQQYDFTYYASNMNTIRCGYDSIILAGGDDAMGLVRSGDHGNTWKVVLDISHADYLESITDIRFGPNGVIYASSFTMLTTEPGSIYASYDLGNSWDVFYRSPLPTVLGFDTCGRLLRGEFGQGIFRYDFQTQQWTWVLQQCVTPQDILTLPNGKIIVACSYYPCYQAGVLLSEDNGESYSFINSGLSSDGDCDEYLLIH